MPWSVKNILYGTECLIIKLGCMIKQNDYCYRLWIQLIVVRSNWLKS